MTTTTDKKICDLEKLIAKLWYDLVSRTILPVTSYDEWRKKALQN